MGCAQSGEGGTKEEQDADREISRQLRRDKEKMAREVKLLLLGAGESGKSTIAKQMKIIHLDGFTDKERESYKSIIFSNTISSMKVLIEACERLGSKIEDSALASRFMEGDYFAGDFTKQHANDMEKLWKDKAVQEVYERRSEFQLNDSAAYYFDRVQDLANEGYLPDEQDVLRSRVKTTGIIETEFEVEKTRFKMVDVGGQRSERKKWMHCFQDVTAVIFCAALSAYDQVLYEDDTTNRMHESLKLFSEICNNRWFIDTAMILFLNKKDLFEDKIKHTSITKCFPEYTGENTYKAASIYIESQFMARNENADKAIYPHHTCATDTGNVRVVFNAVKDIILRKALDQSGFS